MTLSDVNKTYNCRTFCGTAVRFTRLGLDAPAINRCPVCKMTSFRATTFFLGPSSKWMPLCSKSKRKSSAKCLSPEVPRFTESRRASYRPLWVFNLYLKVFTISKVKRNQTTRHKYHWDRQIVGLRNRFPQNKFIYYSIIYEGVATFELNHSSEKVNVTRITLLLFY